MRLGLNIGYWGAGTGPESVELAVLADALGYDSVWAAEAYGSDAVSVLAWIGARTERIALGSAVLQIPARTPAMTAMTAATLDTLSGGRLRLGLGVSGPQVSEGLHGVAFARPLARTREYVDIVRMALDRKPVTYHGRHHELPLPGGPGKALRLTAHPAQPRVPIYLAAVGPKNLELAGEVADGWLGIFTDPDHLDAVATPLRVGAERAGRTLDGFDLVANVQVSVDDDLERAAALLRPTWALYIGGMGSREQNFYNDLACRMGYEHAARQVQELYLAGRPRDAAAAVPLELIDATALIGPVERVLDRARRYAEAGITTLAISPAGATNAHKCAVIRSLSSLMGDDGSAAR